MSNNNNCPLVPTRKNMEVRNNTTIPRLAACFVLHDQIMELYQMAKRGCSDDAWNNAVNDMRLVLSVCKGPPPEPPKVMEVKP